MISDLYVWISRWSDFQHYKPERDRPPAWIKAYTKQLDDDAYLELTGTQRAILHDLRSAFARSHGKLAADTRRLSARIGLQVTSRTLERLNHAGFIELLSRETLDQRLDELYGNSSPHTRPRARKEGEEELEEDPLNPPHSGGLNPRANGTNPRATTKANQRAQALQDFARRCIQEDWPEPSLIDELVTVRGLDPNEARDLIEQTRSAA
jgi:hypothetical protein